MGLHPWHPDVLELTQPQLVWAAIQGREDRGLDPRKTHQEAVAERNQTAVGELVAWADKHISRR